MASNVIYCGVRTESLNKILVHFVIQSINCSSIILFPCLFWSRLLLPAVFLELKVEYFTFQAFIRSLDQTLTDSTRWPLTLWTFTQGTSEMEWWNPCGHLSKRLSDVTNSSFSHIPHAQMWNVWKVVVSSYLDLWSQFRVTGNTRGKCLNHSWVHFYSQVHCDVLRNILGPKRRQVMRGWRKEQNSPLIVTIKSKGMSWK